VSDLLVSLVLVELLVYRALLVLVSLVLVEQPAHKGRKERPVSQAHSAVLKDLPVFQEPQDRQALKVHLAPQAV
jgi:hypothetical protein